jgi:hypothetical protein
MQRNLGIDSISDGKNTSSEQCFVCHLVTTEALYVDKNDGFYDRHRSRDRRHRHLWSKTASLSDDNEPLYCISHRLPDPEGNSTRNLFVSNEVRSRVGIDLHLPSEFLQQHRSEIRTGSIYLCIPGGSIQRSTKTVTVPDSNRIRALNASEIRRHRYPEMHKNRALSDATDSDIAETLLRSTGNKRLLVVRVISTARDEPEESLRQIESAIFGNVSYYENNNTVTEDHVLLDPVSGAPATTVMHHYRAVSFHKLNMIPSTGSGIVNGVAEVLIDLLSVSSGSITSISGLDIVDDIIPVVLDATENYLAHSFLSERQNIVGADTSLSIPSLNDLADHVVFCLPTGALLDNSSDWTAFTNMNERYSFYQQSRCTRLSVVMHEVGHGLLGFLHSGLGDNEYADESGYMGYAYNKVGWPAKSFNPHKMFLTRWTHDRTISIDSAMPQSLSGRLVAFVDYEKLSADVGSSTDVVLIQVGNLYLHYNYADDHNTDTTANANEVTIVKADGNVETSWFLAGLIAGESYSHENFLNSGMYLTIEVCSQEAEQSIAGTFIRYSMVSIYLLDGIQQSSCGNFNAFGHPYGLVADADIPETVPETSMQPIQLADKTGEVVYYALIPSSSETQNFASTSMNSDVQDADVGSVVANMLVLSPHEDGTSSALLNATNGGADEQQNLNQLSSVPDDVVEYISTMIASPFVEDAETATMQSIERVNAVIDDMKLSFLHK